jgi:hypothetical protein
MASESACRLGSRPVVRTQCREPFCVLQQREGRELGQVEPAVEDQRRLDPAVREEQVATELRQHAVLANRR